RGSEGQLWRPMTGRQVFLNRPTVWRPGSAAAPAVCSREGLERAQSALEDTSPATEPLSLRDPATPDSIHAVDRPQWLDNAPRVPYRQAADACRRRCIFLRRPCGRTRLRPCL